MATANDWSSCPICLGLLSGPTSLQCGHTFCMPCFEQWSKVNNSCPACRTAIPSGQKHVINTTIRDALIEKHGNKYRDPVSLESLEKLVPSLEAGKYYHVDPIIHRLMADNRWSANIAILFIRGVCVPRLRELLGVLRIIWPVIDTKFDISNATVPRDFMVHAMVQRYVKGDVEQRKRIEQIAFEHDKWFRRRHEPDILWKRDAPGQPEYLVSHDKAREMFLEAISELPPAKPKRVRSKQSSSAAPSKRRRPAAANGAAPTHSLPK